MTFTFHPLKTIGFSALIWANTTALWAQPAFTHTAFAPHNGDTYEVSRAQGATPGNAGANQTWNFSQLTAFDTVTYEVLPASQIGANVSYNDAEQAAGYGGSWQMLQITGTEYLYYGTTLTPGMAGDIYFDPNTVTRWR